MTDAEKAYARAQEIIAAAKARGESRVSFKVAACRALEVIPPEIAELTEVLTIELDDTQVADLTALGRLTGLTTLRASHTQVHDLTPLADMTQMESLWLDDTQVKNVEPLAAMTSLRRLRLNDTQVETLTALAGLRELRELRLHDTQVKDITPLKNLTAMQLLWLNNTQVEDLSPLTDMRDMETLTLSDTRVKILAPLTAMTRMRTLVLSDTGVSDLRPLAELTFLERLKLDHTQVMALWPLAHMSQLATPGAGLGITFWDTPAAASGPLAEIAAMEDNAERGVALLAYLNDPAQRQQADDAAIEEALRGPILSDALADVEKRAEAKPFEATRLSDGPDKAPDAKFAQIVDALTFVTGRLAAVETENRLDNDIVAGFQDYHQFVQQTDLNPRILRFLGSSIRAAFTSADTSDALDSFDIARVEVFLGEHDQLMAGYFSGSLKVPEYDVETDPDTLIKGLFPRLASAKEILAEADRAGLFAPSVSDALEMLHRRAEGARKTIVTTGDPEEREAAVRELRRASVLTTSYLGRIKGRLTQWIAKQIAHAIENPADTIVKTSGLVGIAKTVIAKLTPVFEQLWHLIGNLPLPF